MLTHQSKEILEHAFEIQVNISNRKYFNLWFVVRFSCRSLQVVQNGVNKVDYRNLCVYLVEFLSSLPQTKHLLFIRGRCALSRKLNLERNSKVRKAFDQEKTKLHHAFLSQLRFSAVTTTRLHFKICVQCS